MTTLHYLGYVDDNGIGQALADGMADPYGLKILTQRYEQATVVRATGYEDAVQQTRDIFGSHPTFF